MGQRGRPRKKPDADPAPENTERIQLIDKACTLAKEPFDDRKDRNKDLPTINSIADELGVTAAKVRKLLLTGGFFSNVQSRVILPLWEAGFNAGEIAKQTGLSLASIYLYIPYTKGAYNLKERSLNAEQNARFHRRKKAVENLKAEPTSLNLWKAIVLFQDYLFTTSGRGSRNGAAFKYTVSAGGTTGKKYAGESVEGWGNEIIIAGHEKSITRSSVDYALNIVLEGGVTGPKQLKVFGASYIYAVFKRIGLIE